jgi:rod shape-determining protein MreD
LIKRVAKYLLMFSFFLALQIIVAPLLAIDDVQPDFLLIGVMVAALRHGAIPAIVTGFWTGLAQDAVVSHLFGLEALSKSIAGFVAGYTAKNKTKFDLQLIIGIALLTALTNHLIRDVIFYFDEGLNFFYLLVRFVIPNALYTVIFVVILRTVWADIFKRSAKG